MPYGAAAFPVEPVDDLCRRHMKRLSLPGLAVAVVRPDDTPIIRTFGHADIAAGRKVVPNTVFRVGSISKMLTALAVARLWEQGRFDLDDPINDHLRATKVTPPKPGDPPVTIRHLLTHRAGLGEITHLGALLNPVRALGAGPAGVPLPPLSELVGPVTRAEVPADTKWAYSNVGFVILGLLVEELSGETFEEHLATHVLAPLGFTRTELTRNSLVSGRLATGYTIKKAREVPAREFEIVVGPAGGYFSTVTDLACLAQMLLHKGMGEHGPVVEPSTLEKMFEPSHRVGSRLPAVGLAFWLREHDANRVVSHGGTVPGFTSGLSVAPDAGIGVVALANQTVMPSAYFGAGGLANDLLDHLLGIRAESKPPDNALAVTSPAGAAPGELCGTYRPDAGFWTNMRVFQYFGSEVEVRPRDHRLCTRALIGPFRRGLELHPVDATDPLLFEAQYDGYTVPFEFARGADGNVDTIHTGFAPCPFTLHKRSRLHTVRAWTRLVPVAVAAGVITAWRRRASSRPQ